MYNRVRLDGLGAHSVRIHKCVKSSTMPTLPSPKISQTHHITLVGLADNRKQRQNEHLNVYFLVKIVCHGPKQLATKEKSIRRLTVFFHLGS